MRKNLRSLGIYGENGFHIEEEREKKGIENEIRRNFLERKKEKEKEGRKKRRVRLRGHDREAYPSVNFYTYVKGSQ